jgi:hypothetical protein
MWEGDICPGRDEMRRRSIVDRAEANTVSLRPRTIDGRLLGLLIALPGTFWSGTYLAVKLADAVSVDATPMAMAFTQVSFGLCLAPIVLIPLVHPRRRGRST